MEYLFYSSPKSTQETMSMKTSMSKATSVKITRSLKKSLVGHAD